MLLKIKRVVKYNPAEGFLYVQFYDEQHPDNDQYYKLVTKAHHPIMYKRMVEADDHKLYTVSVAVKEYIVVFKDESGKEYQDIINRKQDEIAAHVAEDQKIIDQYESNLNCLIECGVPRDLAIKCLHDQQTLNDVQSSYDLINRIDKNIAEVDELTKDFEQFRVITK